MAYMLTLRQKDVKSDPSVHGVYIYTSNNTIGKRKMASMNLTGIVDPSGCYYVLISIHISE